jgi:hypothetical protein
MYRNILAILLLLYAVFGEGLFDKLDKPEPQPDPTPAAKILNIDKPAENVINEVKAFSDLITDPTDRAKIAIFNYDFAHRITGYNADVQQVNDVYSLAGKIFFKDTLVSKYDGLAEEIKGLLVKILTEDNHILTIKEKESLNEYFMGVAWVLIQKG